jgi:hypothetical protein
MMRNWIKVLIGRIIDWIKALKREPICSSKILEELAENKIIISHRIMPNGEHRFKLAKEDGAGYIRTEASKNGAWQKSHYHENLKETYIVQKGWIAYATIINDRCNIELYKEGELFTTQPTIIHNISCQKMLLFIQ